MNKRIIANYKKGILTEGHLVYHCKEIEDYNIRKVQTPDSKPRNKPLTKTEKAEIIEYFKKHNEAPEGFDIYYSKELDDYKITRVKVTEDDFGVTVPLEIKEQCKASLKKKITPPVIEESFGDNII